MIGTFGDTIFEVSSELIRNFNGFSRDTAARYGSHEIIGSQPREEYIGPGLDSISFEITLKSSFGIDVRKEMDKWTSMAREGQAYRLIIGQKALGTDIWLVKSISESWDNITNNGVLVAGKISVTLTEYISEI